MHSRLLTVLLVDDDEEDYLIVRDLLAESGQVRVRLHWASSYDEGLELLLRREHSAYLIDYRLGAHTGLDLMRTALAAGCEAPLILLTGHNQPEIDQAALGAGATDYLVKSELSASLLDRTLRYAVERAHNLAALKASNEQLRQSQKMEAIGRLAGGVAHDFNNMITAIAGYAELLKADITSGLPPQLADLDQILETSRRAASLTQQLLAFSRKQLLQPEVLSLNAVVLEIEPLLRRLIGEDVRLATNLAPDPCLIEIDPGQIQQVILNLVVNARDAMPGGGLVELGTFLITRENGPPVVALVVSDTGHGMDPATLARIFEPFFTTKERGKGTGLGLATVYGIVAQSGGEITVESHVGEGAVFTILLPQARLAEPQLAAAGATGEPAGARGNEHVLLVEDDPTIRNLLATVLHKEGYRVLAACDGEEAIRLATIHAGSFDLLITDVIMPGMSGAELVRRLEAARIGLPVLYISGYTDDAISMHGVSAASVAFLQKPFHPGDFTRKVRTVLEQLGVAATPHVRPGPGWYGSS